MQQPQQQQPPMQQRIHQIPQPSPAPVMYATPMDMNGYTAVYQYPTAFQQSPQQFIGADAGYQSNPQYSLPPPAMYNPVAPPPPAPAAAAYSRPPPQQQAYYTVPHPSMMAHADPPRNPFIGSSKHCLSVFDTPAESSAAYTASWVSSTSSIPPEQKASPDQESNPPTPSEYSNNWHENPGNRASPLVDEFAAGASATSGFSPPLGDNTLDAQLASLNISHADFTANNGKGPMPSGFYGARTINPQMSTQSMAIHSMGHVQPQYMTQTPPMYYQAAPLQSTNANYYVSNQPPPTQHVIDVSGNTWADMVKKGGNCGVGEARAPSATPNSEQISGPGNQNMANSRRYGKQHSGNGGSQNHNGRGNQNQNRRRQRNDRNTNGNGSHQGGEFGTFIAPGSKSQQNYASQPSNQYNPSPSPVNVMNGGNANNISGSFTGTPNGGQHFNYPPPYFMPPGMSVPPASTSTPMGMSSGNNNPNQPGGFRSTWLDERLPALDMVIHDNAISAQTIVQEKMMKSKGGANQFVVPPPNMMMAPPPGGPSGMHRFITPGAFGMTSFIQMCPSNYQQHSSSPSQGQYGTRGRRNFNGHNGRNRNPKHNAQHPDDVDIDKSDAVVEAAASEETLKPDDEKANNDSGKGELDTEKN